MNERLNRAAVREVATVPVFHMEPRHVCPFHPDCECEAACIAGGDARRMRIILLAGVALTVAIGVGLIIRSFF
jgi:hypothetical protein